MAFYLCSVKSGGVPHVTSQRAQGLFGLYMASTLCNSNVREIYPNMPIPPYVCWECKIKMDRIQADKERWQLVKNAFREVFIAHHNPDGGDQT